MTVDNRRRSHTEPAEQAVARVREAKIKPAEFQYVTESCCLEDAPIIANSTRSAGM